MEKKSFRIHTTPNGSDKSLIVKLDQSYDTLEILSLKISQDKIYRSFSADYGVLVGRVIANQGLGVPNAKVSIFIPISDEDKENPIISDIYPYQKITDTDKLNIRYNLLPKSGVGAGTFPSKQEILDNEVYFEVYQKYYKFTTVTNSSGDYMFFGVPVGQQTVHVDVDLSDIGQYSYTVGDLIANGVPEKLFDKETTPNGFTYRFRGGLNLEQLPQIVSRNSSLDIIPLWGDIEEGEIGITRHDFNLNIIQNTTAFIGFNVGVDTTERRYDDHSDNGIFNGSSPYIDRGNNHSPGNITDFNNRGLPEGSIKVYKPDENGGEIRLTEGVDYILENAGASYMLVLPCYSDKKVTNEFGEEVDSPDPNKGIATKGLYKIEFTDTGDRIGNMNIQRVNRTIENDSHWFEVTRNRVYSVRMMIGFDGGENQYGLRINNDIYRHFYGDNNIWIHGLLYFGGLDTGSHRPDWLLTNGNYYKTATAIIDVTDYMSKLVDATGVEKKGGFKYKHFNKNVLEPYRIELEKQNTDTPAYKRYAPAKSDNQGNYMFSIGWEDTSCWDMLRKYVKI